MFKWTHVFIGRMQIEQHFYWRNFWWAATGTPLCCWIYTEQFDQPKQVRIDHCCVLNSLGTAYFSSVPHSHKHTLAMWAITFYLLENIDEQHLSHNFVKDAVLQAVSVLCKPSMPIGEYKFIMQVWEYLTISKTMIFFTLGSNLDIVLINIQFIQ